MVRPGVSHGLTIRVLAKGLVGQCWGVNRVTVVHTRGINHLLDQGWLGQMEGTIFKGFKLDSQEGSKGVVHCQLEAHLLHGLKEVICLLRVLERHAKVINIGCYHHSRLAVQARIMSALHQSIVLECL